MLQGVFQQGEMPVVLHPTKLSLRCPEGRRTPPQLLVARAPACHALRLRLQPCHHALDQVGGLDAHAQLGKDMQPRQREGFLEAFRKTRGGGFVVEPQFAMQPIQRALGVRIRRMGPRGRRFRRHIG